MSKVAVVFWSGTGNTEQMAEAVAEGAKSAGAEVTLANVNDFDSSSVADFDGIAFGCPAMVRRFLRTASLSLFSMNVKVH